MTAVVVSSVVLVIVTVAVHLACLRGLLRLLLRLGSLHHARVGVMVLGALLGHLIEIGLFGVAIGWLEGPGRHGTLTGATAGDLTWAECYYYSAVTFTSLGFGDLAPTGHLRLLAAVEVLTGVVLVAWTASFLFLVMQRVWGPAVRRALRTHPPAVGATGAPDTPEPRGEAS
jgi:hypothetical protein